jgi:hypothetical protein
MRKIVRVLAWISAVLLLLSLATLTWVDRSPILQQAHVQQTLARIKATPWKSTSGEFWVAGWAKANVTPSHPVPLVGYSPRGNYEFIQDSSFVKVLTLSNGTSQVAWLNYELLIVHPYLAQQVRQGIQEAGLNLDQVLFTATHTHAGMGGYMPGPLGEIAFGGYEEDVVRGLVQGSVQALQAALASQDTVTVSYRQTAAPAYVSNRFVKGGPIDPFLRQVLFEKRDGKKAVFLTYAAHATALSSKFMGLSGDYPQALTKGLEGEGYDFALYASGTVGSHRPNTEGNTPEKVKAYALAIQQVLQADSSSRYVENMQQLRLADVEVSLGDPQLRISKDIRLRPWLFRYLVGDTPAYFNVTQVGSLLFISSSGELSGVFYEEWEKLAKAQGLHLVITVFNGGYVGYITPDELYDEDFHEVRETNWFGPGNGTYFDLMMQELIKKAGQ